MPTDYSTKHRWQNRVRWWAAWQLNRLPWTCWANLVSWAMHSKPLLDRYGDGDIRQDSMCRTATACGRCYCQKIATPPVDLCHNGHPFEPGRTVDDAPGESRPDWCNVCGEGRVPPSGGSDA